MRKLLIVTVASFAFGCASLGQDVRDFGESGAEAVDKTSEFLVDKGVGGVIRNTFNAIGELFDLGNDAVETIKPGDDEDPGVE